MTPVANETASGAATPSRSSVWVLPAFAGVLGIAMILESTTLPLFERYAGLGAGFLVAFVGAALVVIAAVLAWQVKQGVPFEPEEAEGVDLDQPVSLRGLAFAATGVAAPIFTMPFLGFPLGAAIAYVCVTRGFGSRNLPLEIGAGVVLSAVTWFAFTKLGVQLGPFLPFRI